MACEDVEGTISFASLPDSLPAFRDAPILEDPIPTDREAALAELHYWWDHHDMVERRLIRLERFFTDAELDALLERE
jgi:hypothetical protein